MKNVARRRRFDAARQETFFATLAATCNVVAACRRAGVLPSGVYRLRQKSAVFRTRWAAAVREGYARLELAMLERMMNGTVKTITRHDGSIETVHEYSNAVALSLLKVHREAAAEIATRHDPAEIEEARDRIATKIDRLRKRLEPQEAGGGADE